MLNSKMLSRPILVLVLSTILAGWAWATMSASYYPDHDNYWTGRAMNSTAGYSKHNADIMYGKDPPDDKWQGWVKINLSEVPANAVISDAVLVYHVISQAPQGLAHTYLTLVADDPVSADAATLWNDITGGTIVAPDLAADKGWVERPLNTDGIAAVQEALGQGWIAFGFYKWDETETKGHAKGYQAEKWRPYLRLTYGYGDMAVVEIVQPTGEVLAGSAVDPLVSVSNNGDFELPFKLTLTIGDGTTESYREVVDVPGVPAGQTADIPFPQWTADGAAGERVATATLDLEYDANPANNFLVNWFNVYTEQQGGGGGEPPPPPPAIQWGWQEMAQVPALPSGRPVKVGGLLAADPSTGLVYVLKGNKTPEFAVYDPVADRWRQLAPIPGAWPGKGAEAVADGAGSVFAVPGNNTSEFWRYDIAGNTWERLPEVPAGPFSKKVRGGTGMAHVGQYGLNYIYLLKGPKPEFMRYNVEARAWTRLADAPTSSNPKWGRGSWLVYDGSGRVYAHQADVNKFWYYDLATDAWGIQLSGMPLYGASGRAKKSKDGGSGAWREGTVFALKGNKTGEFWTWDPASVLWQELEPMPAFGTTLRNVLPRVGADLVNYPFGRVVYALKGNKTLEFWRYTMKPLSMDGREKRDDGVAGAAKPAGRNRLAAVPNPAFGSSVRLEYSVPASGRAVVALYDASGRLAAQEELVLARSGGVQLRLEGLSAGTYILRLTGDRYSLAGRLVVAR